MAAPMAGHNRSLKPSEDSEDDPVENLINKTGCAKYHYAVQECMFEKKDWRLCQEEVLKFKQCVSNSSVTQKQTANPTS